MGQTAPISEPGPQTEVFENRQARLAWERERLEEARRSIAAGDFIADEALDAWLDAWVAGEPLPEDR